MVLKVFAKNSFERTLIANTGAAIEFVQDDHVIVTALLEEKNQLEKLGLAVEVDRSISKLDFPSKDSDYHDYSEMTQKLRQIQQLHSNITELKSIGRTVEGRDIWALVIKANKNSTNTPQAIFMGGHHAREHLSVETPLRLAEWLLQQYSAGNARVQTLVNEREIHIIPAVNPDGLEFDISGFRYKMWRKNRNLNSDGTYGVDLNRNYGYKWGTGGSSANPRSDTYKGPAPFSEPETQAIQAYVKSLNRAKVLLSFHTFSELILYPWGHSKDSIANPKDLQVFEKMANQMATWNKYKPMQASDLYIASGDTTDWAYGELGIFAFTFELDPKQQLIGGFYPGDEIIEDVVEKNKEAFLYMIDLADDPYRAL
jgi:carboxypeptidase T